MLIPVVCAVSCGGDDELDPKEACNQMVDAFTNAWVRCNIEVTTARQTWTQAFSSCNPNSVDRARFEQCKADLNSADCASVKNLPASCKGVLAQ